MEKIEIIEKLSERVKTAHEFIKTKKLSRDDVNFQIGYIQGLQVVIDLLGGKNDNK